MDDDFELEEEANVFCFDPLFESKESEWDEIRKEIVGDYFQQLEQQSEESEQSDENDNEVVSVLSSSSHHV